MWVCCVCAGQYEDSGADVGEGEVPGGPHHLARRQAHHSAGRGETPRQLKPKGTVVTVFFDLGYREVVFFDLGFREVVFFIFSYRGVVFFVL